MRAVFFEAFAQLPRVQQVADPTPAPGGVVIQVEATGLCRSDWHGWMGHDPDIRVPHVPGHELAGVIAAVGREVRRFKAGDRVTVPFVCGCGRCAECEGGNPQVCPSQFQPGFTAWGSFAEYVAIKYADANLVALPDWLDYATAASLGCRFATAFRAVVDQGRVRRGEWVAVHGCGGVGLSAIMIASALGANVVAVDVAEDKLRFAREMGANALVDARHTADVAAAVHAATAGGAHLSVDALGSVVTCVNSIASLRRRGRHVQVGLLPQAVEIPMSRVIGHELEILGSHGIQAARYGAILDMMEEGKLQPQKLVGRQITLDEVPQALADMRDSPGLGMTMIFPGRGTKARV
jgi:alcohol dehydrogenase